MVNLINLGELGQQIVLFSGISFALVFWIWGKLRYDIVALIALAIIVLGGVVPFESAFLGFSSPAVIIVASVLVMSKGITNTGFIDLVLSKIPIRNKSLWVQIFFLTVMTAVLSSFIYNIGSLAIVMPLAIRLAKKSKLSTAYYLMPIAFASHMGGLLTLIGNAPNIIVSSFRADVVGAPFRMFDFGQVGVWIVVPCVLFLSLIGWRLMPKRKKRAGTDETSPSVSDYTSELLVPAESELISTSIHDLKVKVKEDFTVCAIIRGNEKIEDPPPSENIYENDLLLVRSDPEILKTIINLTDLEVSSPSKKDDNDKDKDKEKDLSESEAIVGLVSKIRGSRLRDLEIDVKYEVEVSALSRYGERLKEKLKDINLKYGDVLLLRGSERNINDFLSDFGLLPLAKRDTNLLSSSNMAAAMLIFLTSILLTTFRIFPVEISFFLGAVAMIVAGILTVKEGYESIDWSIVVVLGAMIPFGEAMISSGAGQLVSSVLLMISPSASATMMLGLVLVICILMSDLVNNVGVAVLMAPVAILIAQELGVSVDPFLMAVAIGGSCAFLTPVGHQANLLVLEPGKYEFTDYWKLGIFLNLIIFFTAIFYIPLIWPF